MTKLFGYDKFLPMNTGKCRMTKLRRLSSFIVVRILLCFMALSPTFELFSFETVTKLDHFFFNVRHPFDSLLVISVVVM